MTSSRWSSTTSFCDATPAPGRRTLRIALVMASAMTAQERGEVRLLAVRGDRHVGRSDVEPDVEFQLLGRFGDGVAKPAAEQVDFALVALQRHFAGDRGAVDADAATDVLFGLRTPRPRPRRGCRARRRRAERRFAVGDRVGPVGEGVGADGAEALRIDRLGRLPRRSPGAAPACSRSTSWHAIRLKPASGDDLARAPAGAAVEARDQRPHGNAAAGRQKLMELRQVVPPWRRLAGVGVALRQMDGELGPTQRVGVGRQIGPEADLDPGSDSARRSRFSRPLGCSRRAQA